MNITGVLDVDQSILGHNHLKRRYNSLVFVCRKWRDFFQLRQTKSSKNLAFCNSIPIHNYQQKVRVIIIENAKKLARSTITQYYFYDYMNTCLELGNIQMLNLLHCQKNIKDQSYEIASQYGQLQTIEWLWKHDPYPYLYTTIAINAAKQGHVPVLQWYKQHGGRMINRIIECAIQQDQVQCLQFICENEHPSLDKLMVEAIFWDSIDCAKYLYTMGCKMNENMMITASIENRFDDIKWLHENNCPWSERVSHHFIDHGKYEYFLWAVENGCPFDKEYCLSQIYVRNYNFPQQKEKSNACLHWIRNIE